MRLKNLSVQAVLFFTTVSLSAQEKESDKPFSLIRKTDNILVYERWVQFPKSNPPVEAREVKGVFYVNATIEEAVALVKDETKIQRWQDHVSKFKVYPKNDSVWYEYSYHDIPWPVSDQDHFLMYTVKENIPGRLFMTFETVENEKLAPVDDNADRMTLAGSWLFETTDSKLRITYRILSMPSGIPRIFTDPVIRSNLMSTIKGYISTIEEKKSQIPNDK